MSPTTRREFLERSMFAAAAAAGGALPLMLPTASARAAGPNHVLRVAVLGVNGRGQDHLSGYLGQKNDCEIVAICDPDEKVGQTKGVDRVEKATGKKPVYYNDPRKVMDNKDIDIVSIATPNHWHALASIWALQAGKDVYVEKPVSHNVMEGRRIVDAARKYNRICQTGTQCRSMPGTIEAIQFVKSGEIGPVSVARGLCYKNRGAIGARGTYDPPASVNYDVWCGPAPKHPLTRPKFHYDWHWQWDFGNGDLGNQGIHQMDIARWGLGVDHIGFGVTSYGGRFGYEDAGETANTQVSIHEYGDKTLVFEVRGLPSDDYQGARVGVIFHGQTGYVVLASYDGGAAFDLKGNKIRDFKGSANHYVNFISAVRSRKPADLHAEVTEGHLSSALCHLGNISYRLGEQVTVAELRERLGSAKASAEALETLGRFTSHLSTGKNAVDLARHKVTLGPTLAIDPKHETFTGPNSERANPLLTRHYRAGYVVPASASDV